MRDETTDVTDTVEILGVFVGTIGAYGPRGEPSAYLKRPAPGPVEVGPLGIAGDQQADLTVHGGVDKAMHHYPFDHYAAFAAERPEFAARLGQPGFFAENISTEGWTEWDVCLGDRFELGTAEIELSEGRSPCWKLGHRFGDPSMIEAVVKTRRAGWYYRVLQPGSFSAGDMLRLVARPCPQWPVARAFGLLIAGDRDLEALAELRDMATLGASWRRKADRLHTAMLAKG